MTHRPIRLGISKRTSSYSFYASMPSVNRAGSGEVNDGNFFYSAYGLTFRSNLPLSKVPETRCLTGSPDCDLHFDCAPGATISLAPKVLTYESSYRDTSGEPCLRIWWLGEGDCSQMSYSDGHQFWLSRSGTDVWVTWPDGSSLDEATGYLLGPVLGVLLRYRGVVCLHGSAVARNGQAVVFVGPPGAGKSTTAAALAQRGYTLLGDDIAALEERAGVVHVHPAYPGVSLWPNSVELLYGARKPELRPHATGDKVCLSSAQGLQFELGALPLDRIYILEGAENESSSSSSDDSAQERFLALIANTYATSILDASMRANEFAFLGRLASQIPIHRIGWDRGQGALDRRCDLVMSKSEQLR